MPVLMWIKHDNVYNGQLASRDQHVHQHPRQHPHALKTFKFRSHHRRYCVLGASTHPQQKP